MINIGTAQAKKADSVERVICWFSCGAASAVATKLALKKYSGKYPIEIIYQETGSEHHDNERFLRDCATWFGAPIIRLRSKKYEDIWDVFSKTRYLVGIGGARCTSELKRRVAEDYIHHGYDVEVFGYTIEENARVDRFRTNNPERNIDAILVENGLDKNDCFAIIDRAGIELPAMYRLGYGHSNCIGCPKGSMGYWNKIRVDFPGVFNRMARVERELDVAINKKFKNKTRNRVFLDELDPGAGRAEPLPDMSCGIMCISAELEIKK